MQRMLIIGCGDIAQRALLKLLRRYRVHALLRDASGDEAKRLRALGVRVLQGDLDQPASLRRLRGLAEVVLHSAPPAPGPAAASQADRDMRTRHLLAALRRPAKRGSLPRDFGHAVARSRVQRLVYISTSGVYGDCRGALINETRRLAPTTPRARRRVDAESQLRRWGRQPQGPRLSILRVPGIYAPDRLPLARIQRADPVLRREDDVITNHIHADDLAGIVCAALRRGRHQRIYHASDDSHQAGALYMADWFDAVADRAALPRPPRLSRQQAVQQLSPQVLSFMNESRRLDNTRLKRELRLHLLYPDVYAGLATLKQES